MTNRRWEKLIESKLSNRLIKKSFREKVDLDDLSIETRNIVYDKLKNMMRIAVRNNDKIGVDDLLAQGVDINASCGNEGSPLHYASCFDANVSFVQFLIDAGADVNLQQEKNAIIKNATPLYSGVDGIASVDVIQTLIDAGADVNVKNYFDDTPLHSAVCSRVHEFDMIQLLVDSGAYVNVQNKDGDTPLHLAITDRAAIQDKDADRIIQLLLDAGSNVKIVNDRQYTALDKAVMHEVDPEIIQMLIQYGAINNRVI